MRITSQEAVCDTCTTTPTDSAILAFPARKRSRRESKAGARRGALATVVELRTQGERNKLMRIETTKLDVIGAAQEAGAQAVCAVAFFLDVDGRVRRVLSGIEPEFAAVLAPSMGQTLELLRSHAEKAEVFHAKP
ncbi:hypothetical protein [Paraburkholderia lycopersici]|uniref:Uncharacterized protein n=1 Tax=Paraburkholderia lycopersici TaxID=416944 RepID=A0A1G6ZHF0_9BURK|nr:hypothetical protein [Paraburkholderia lycopersici]SDE01687.1 hypothetical protein SAMN05421548_13078 [Paraburkholderia lycopersici]